jgi:hypothetical protein
MVATMATMTTQLTMLLKETLKIHGMWTEHSTTANTGLAPFGHLAPQDKLY